MLNAGRLWSLNYARRGAFRCQHFHTATASSFVSNRNVCVYVCCGQRSAVDLFRQHKKSFVIVPCGSQRLLCMSSPRFNETSQKVPKAGKRLPQVHFTWRNFFLSLGIGTAFLMYMWHVQRQKEIELEKKRRRAIGKSKIGGPWELVNAHTGKVQTQADYLDKWVLIYFGFTHCPDICPDEIEKMCKVAELLGSSSDNAPIQPLFFTIDPDRDSAKAVTAYCTDFSPKLIGFTGSEEQVEKVSRTFRVYRSKGPRDESDDYIVDHTVIMYLIDPDGTFVEYYGQNRKAEEVADAISFQMLKYKRGKEKGWW